VFPLSKSEVVKALYLVGGKAPVERNSQSGWVPRTADIGEMHGDKRRITLRNSDDRMLTARRPNARLKLSTR
jgi:hypothetical protein